MKKQQGQWTQQGEYLSRCFRVVNGFRIIELVKSGMPSMFAIRPNCSERTFYFRSFSKAEMFANHFTNKHRDAFWFRRWSHRMSQEFVERMNTPSCNVPY